MTKVFALVAFGCLLQLVRPEILPAYEGTGAGRGSMRRAWFDNYKSEKVLRSAENALRESTSEETRQSKMKWLNDLAEWLEKEDEEWTEEDDKWVEEIMKWFEELGEEEEEDWSDENGSWEDDDEEWLQGLTGKDSDYDDDDDDSSSWNLTSSEERELEKFEMIYEWLLSLGYDMKKDGPLQQQKQQPQKKFASV